VAVRSEHAREVEVLRLAARRLTNRDIGEALCLSARAVGVAVGTPPGGVVGH
jgi:DNA-binding NarL/FixJ family response regulator